MKASPIVAALRALFLLSTVILLVACATGNGTGNAALDERTAGTMVDDNAIEFSARNSLFKDGGIGNDQHIKITSFNRTVLLTGEVESEELRQAVAEVVSEDGRIANVVNELAVGEQSGLGTRSRDTILTGQIKASLLGLGLPGFDPAKVKVVSVRGNAYLMGLVTEAQAEKIVERVRRVRGVDKVVKVFEIIPTSATGT